jgi:hypothetical protein
MNANKVIKSLNALIEATSDLARATLKEGGLTSEESQLVCILNGLSEAEKSVNSIEDSDVKVSSKRELSNADLQKTPERELVIDSDRIEHTVDIINSAAEQIYIDFK